MHCDHKTWDELDYMNLMAVLDRLVCIFMDC